MNLVLRNGGGERLGIKWIDILFGNFRIDLVLGFRNKGLMDDGVVLF